MPAPEEDAGDEREKEEGGDDAVMADGEAVEGDES